MKILVVGNGGREHAIAWKLASSPSVEQVFVAKGNAGTHREPRIQNVDIEPMDFAGLTAFVREKNITFTVIGPEAPLVGGIVDYFTEQGLPCLGPTQQAAQLEGSKSYAKAFMQRHDIPTAKSAAFTDTSLALGYLNHCQFPIVIKADGLAAGKGVIIAQDLKQATNAVESMLGTQKKFGDAGQQIIIEDFIEGTEVSFIVLSDGTHILPFATSQDHKARDDGDKGPNTGGMGAYSPAPMVSPELFQEIMTTVIEPTIQGLTEEGAPFKGFLYAGLMLSPTQGIQVLEYNCRFGDPETQPILMRLTSDFAALCQAALTEELAGMEATWDPRVALGVVLASHGYPDSYHTGTPIPTINELSASEDYKVFHAGTKMEAGQVLTSGGRVLCVTALGDNYKDAQAKAYRLVKKAKWDGAYARSDIGYKAILSEN